MIKAVEDAYNERMMLSLFLPDSVVIDAPNSHKILLKVSFSTLNNQSYFDWSMQIEMEGTGIVLSKFNRLVSALEIASIEVSMSV